MSEAQFYAGRVRVPFDKLTTAETEAVFKYATEGAYRDNVRTSSGLAVALEGGRFVHVTHDELLTLALCQIVRAESAFHDIRCAFSMRITDRMTWRELAGAAKGTIEMCSEYRKRLAIAERTIAELRVQVAGLEQL